MSTDTAFALGVRPCSSHRSAPRACACFCFTLAVVDDLVALLVITTVYTRPCRSWLWPIAVA